MPWDNCCFIPVKHKIVVLVSAVKKLFCGNGQNCHSAVSHCGADVLPIHILSTDNESRPVFPVVYIAGKNFCG